MIKDFDEVIGNNYQDAKIEYNYHSHNYLCGHAKGTVKDYVEEAIKAGLKVIGISDHGHIKIQEPNSYIGLKEIDEKYLPQFDEAIKLYSNDIIIKKGLELEYCYDDDEYYKELLKRLDYLILGMHNYYNKELKFVFSGNPTIEDALFFFNVMIDGIKSGFFKILAHPDIIVGKFNGACPKIVKDKMEEAIKEAMKANMFVEINANGFRNNGGGYPTDELIEIVKRLNTKVVIGSDNHKPEVLLDDTTKKMVTYCRNKGLNIAKLEEIDI